MPRDLRHLDLTDADIARAVASHGEFDQLVRRFAASVGPASGGPNLLALLSAVASEGVWLEGALRIELHDANGSTELLLQSEVGPGMHERVMDPVTLRVPLAEFTRAATLAPELLGALAVVERTDRHLVLMLPLEDSASVRISPDSLGPRAGGPDDK